MEENERRELLDLIAGFIEEGFAGNVAAMFRKDPRLYELAGDLIRDERFLVRVGTAVLFEELAATRPEETSLAVPVLLPLLHDPTASVRGDAATLLGIIGSPEGLAALPPLLADPDPQVAEIVADIFVDQGS